MVVLAHAPAESASVEARMTKLNAIARRKAPSIKQLMSMLPLSPKGDMTILEAASEKKRRGRPTVLPSWWDVRMNLNAKTTRGQHNRYYKHRALEVLGLLDGLKKGRRVPKQFAWLVNWEALKRNTRGALKSGVLAEIGRFAEDNEEVAIEAAKRICRMAPATVKAAEAIVRHWRVVCWKA